MGLNVPLYLFEINCCILMFYLFYQGVLRRLPTHPLHRVYLLVMPLLALMIPGMSPELLPVATTVDGGEAMQLFGSWVPAGLRQYLSGLSLTIADLGLILYFSGFTLLAFRLMDRLWSIREWVHGHKKHDLFSSLHSTKQPFPSASIFLLLSWKKDQLPKEELLVLEQDRMHLRPWHGWETTWMELMVMVQWFQPLLFLMRRELIRVEQQLSSQYIHARLGRSKATPPAGDASWRFSLIAPLVFALLTIFSFDGITDRLGYPVLEPLTQRMDHWSKSTILSFQEPPSEEARYLAWGSKQIMLSPIQEGGWIDYEVAEISPYFFGKLQSNSLEIRQGSERIPIKRFKAVLAPAPADELLTIYSLEEFSERIQSFPLFPELTIYLRMDDDQGNSWLAMVSVTKDGSIYGGEEAIRQLVEEPAAIRWTMGSHLEYIDLDQLQEDSLYTMQWGNMEIQIEKYANPNVYKGILTVTEEELARLFNQPISFSKKGEPQAIEFIEFSRFNPRKRESIYWKPEIENGQAFFRSHNRPSTLDKYIKQGGHFSLFGEVGEININVVSIRIHDPNSPFEPKVHLREVDISSPQFGFQVINRDGFKTRLKIDTTNMKTRHIVDMYRDESRFEIIHVPGYQTNNRLVSMKSDDLLVQKALDDGKEKWFYSDHLREYYSTSVSTPQLQWGDMFSTPNSEIYSFEEFQENLHHPLKLMVGEDELFMQHAFFRVIPTASEPFIIPVNENMLNFPQQVDLLHKIGPETSVVLDGIIVETSEGEPLLFPSGFVFQIGKATQNHQLEVKIEESGQEGTPLMEITEDLIRFQNYPLTELIAELTYTRVNRIEFKGLKADPILSVEFLASEYTPERSYEILLNTLQKKYRFSTHWKRIHRDHWKMQIANTAKLEAALYDGEAPTVEQVQVFDPDGFHLLTGITLEELNEFLETRYEVIFDMFPNAYTEETFIFGLDFSSFEQVRQQLLDEYGLHIADANWLYDGMEVRFY